MVTANAEDLAQQIAADEPSPIDYGPITMPPEILEEDEEIERYPLNVPEGNIRVVPVDEMFQSGARE